MYIFMCLYLLGTAVFIIFNFPKMYSVENIWMFYSYLAFTFSTLLFLSFAWLMNPGLLHG